MCCMKKCLKRICACILAMLLCGCARNEKLSNETVSTKDASGVSFLEEDEAAWMDAWRDNKVDETYAVINQPVHKVIIEGEKEDTAGNLFIGEGGCTYFKNHAFENKNNSWSGVSGVTTGGEEFSARITVDPDRRGSQIFVLGPKAGEKGYVASYFPFNEYGEVTEQWLYELDESFALVRSVKANIKQKRALSSVMGDHDGNFHVTYQKANGKNAYAVISSDGECLFEAETEASKWLSLCAYGTGFIALRTTDYNPYGMQTANERRFYRADLKTGELAELSASKDEGIRDKLGSFANSASAAALVSESELAWCDKTGVFICKAQGGTVRNVYTWSNHGMTSPQVDDMMVTTKGDIGILYREGEEYHYLLLTPTGEREELKQITFVTSPYHKNEYLKAAAYFKKRYPAYIINVVDDYDETSLLTQLGSGKGPVLIDTELTGFEELENLWQPLDGFLEQAGLADELLPEAMELGKIGGVTYGIVKNFRIETLLVTQAGPRDWDYKGYLDALEDFDGAALTYFAIDTPLDWREKYFSLMSVGEEDNYYYDRNSGKMIFETPEFDRILRLSEKALKCPPAADGKTLQEGEALCEEVDLLILAQVIRLRRRLEKNDERAIGYPTGQGARHLMIAQYPIAMRSTASDEEKEIAYTFLKCVLSQEVLMEDQMLSVRKDVLEHQFQEYERNAAILRESGKYGEDYAPELDWEEDTKFLEELLKNSVIKRPLPTKVQAVFNEEFRDFENGTISAEALKDHLRGRIGLYLEE